MAEQTIQKSGRKNGVAWDASIEVTAGGQYTIRSLKVRDENGTALPAYEERTAVHDNIDDALKEAEQVALTIARK